MKYIKEQITRDIIITLPKSILWSDYQKELDAVKDGSQIMNFKVNNFPKTKIGAKCYLLYNGFIRGYMFITGFSEKEFVCSTTGNTFNGKFIERSGDFFKIDPIPMKGFQGFRYF